ncbi:hypothetical protein AVEN_192405-1 [Araneus ventricosus]|uniref:DUF7042 domain-containing protein n=1 Tax=Araneus ventricosus TaxID=182803 RepID=A0A4Y2W8E8_ARAVE|nr:hypothetical protein AVEN_192405-1 [Araneus ventricosus]
MFTGKQDLTSTLASDHTFCPISGKFRFTYTASNGEFRCDQTMSELSNCPDGNTLGVKFRQCSFPDMVVSACSDHGCNDQSVERIKTAWSGSSVSKHMENSPVLVISSSLVVISFNEMTSEHEKNDDEPEEKPASVQENFQSFVL